MHRQRDKVFLSNYSCLYTQGIRGFLLLENIFVCYMDPFNLKNIDEMCDSLFHLFESHKMRKSTGGAFFIALF